MPNKFYEQLQDQSEGDWVKVVRCKDCRLSTVTELRELYCYRLEDIVGAEDYCSKGERKEVETGNTYSIGKIELPKGVFRQIYDEERREDAKTD